MAKSKKKTTGYDREVTDTPDGNEWTTGKFTFLFTGTPGVNVALKVDEKWQPICYARDLKEAGFFAEGFTAGVQTAKRYPHLLPSY